MFVFLFFSFSFLFFNSHTHTKKQTKSNLLSISSIGLSEMRKDHDFWKILKIIPDPERCNLFFNTILPDMEKTLQNFKLFRTVTTLYDPCSSLTTLSLLHTLPQKGTNICSTRLEQHLRKCQNKIFPDLLKLETIHLPSKHALVISALHTCAHAYHHEP